MIELNGRTVMDDGTVVFTTSGILDLLYRGNTDIAGIVVENSDEAEKFNHYADFFKYGHLTIYDGVVNDLNTTSLNWMLPDQYKQLDVRSYVTGLCETPEEIERVNTEMTLYEKFHLIDLLRCMKYIIDQFRENKMVWGVGRGSSVSSYVLFLLGVHKIDSIRYGLDINDFLK